MTWTRLDDSWTDSPRLADLPIAARWHYLCMIQFCSRADLHTGTMRKVDALRCSDVDDPKTAVNALSAAGLVEQDEDPRKVRVVHIADHVPPTSVREKAERDRERKERSRRHAAGDHSTCYRTRCDHGTLDEPKPTRHTTADPSRVTDSVTSHVTPPHGPDSHVKSHVTPGRDGTGQDGFGSTYRTDEHEHINPATGEVIPEPWSPEDLGQTTKETP